MDREKLMKGIELDKDIAKKKAKLKDIIAIDEIAFYNRGLHEETLCENDDMFKELKQMYIKSLEEGIEKLEEEFDAI